ncbi:MAG: type II toxin-antitoxin system death-on-curing family toxin [Demequinaceae bacterium]|nr:type II toxin-antitoxin system death-on-curing family toxin [Demequinaceae bacterium]
MPLRVVLAIVEAEGLGPVRDLGLLESALERPMTTLMGADAYPALETKAAALLHSVCLNRALIDGNTRLAALVAMMFLDINGCEPTLTNDELFDLTMTVASGRLRDADDIAARLTTRTR